MATASDTPKHVPSQPPTDPRAAWHAERIVAEAIVEHLELSGWRLEHRPKPTVTPAR